MLAICNKYVMRRSRSLQLCNFVLLEIWCACGGCVGAREGLLLLIASGKDYPDYFLYLPTEENKRIVDPAFYPPVQQLEIES